MRLLRALLLPLLLFTAALMFFEERLIFFPERGDVGPSPGEDVWLTPAHGARIHAWHLTRPRARATLLHLHGNAGHLEYRRQLVTALAGLGVNVLAIDYRGYGRSDGGFPNERSVNQDARAAYDWLRARQPSLPIVLHGESLGAGPACELALQAPPAALILQSAFTSIPAMAAVVYPFLPLRPLIRTRFDNLAKIPKIVGPKLFIHSRRDEIIPFAMGEQLFAAAQPPKQKLWLSTSGHNDALFVEHAALIGTMRRFLSQLGLVESPP